MFGIKPLDELLGGIKLGNILLMVGDRHAAGMLHALAVRSQLPEEEGGRGILSNSATSACVFLCLLSSGTRKGYEYTKRFRSEGSSITYTRSNPKHNSPNAPPFSFPPLAIEGACYSTAFSSVV